MNCPQCGTGLGEGAKACATCGWSQSRRTLWIVLGCVFGFLLLACCGAGTYLFVQGKKFVKAVEGEIVPVQIGLLRAQVVNFARVKGRAPATLEEASAEPLISRTGEKVEIRIENGNRSADRWQRPFRFTMNPDRTFEVRSAGPDGQFDSADDLFEKGSLDDDLQALLKETEDRAKRMVEKGVRAIGFDPGAFEEKETPPAPPPPAPPPGGGGK